MASNITCNYWNNGGYILTSIVSGVLFGIAPVLIKLASADFFISYYTIIGGLLALAAFFLMQKAMYSGKISTVVSLVTAVSILTALVTSILMLSESVGYVKWFGAIAIILGAIELTRENSSEKKKK
ncbi:hypothetical protein HYZ41_02265 [archaeon]|nr:hypothetical protein [archaeon]